MKNKGKNKNSSIFLEDEAKDTEKDVLEEDIAQSINIVNRNREELDEQRNKRIGKFERNANGQMILRPEHRYKIDYRLIVSMIVLIFAIVWIITDYGPIFGINIKGVSDDLNSSKIELVTKDSDMYGMYDEDIYVYSNNSITTYDYNGKVTWNFTFSESFTPNIVTEGNYMLVTNNTTGMMYLFENRKEILNKKIDGTIKNTFLDKFGNIAVEYSTNAGYNNIVSVLDKKGRNKYDAYLSRDNIISLKMLNSAEKIIFAETVTDSANIGVSFKMIDITKSENQLREIASLGNNFVYNFEIQGKKIYALLDDGIISLDIDNGNIEKLKEFESTQIMFTALNNKSFTTLERNLNTNQYSINTMNFAGSQVSTTEIESVPKLMVSSDLVNYYIYQDHVYILNKWGIELKSRDISFTPKKCIVFNNNKSLALVYTNKIYILNI